MHRLTWYWRDNSWHLVEVVLAKKEALSLLCSRCIPSARCGTHCVACITPKYCLIAKNWALRHRLHKSCRRRRTIIVGVQTPLSTWIRIQKRNFNALRCFYTHRVHKPSLLYDMHIPNSVAGRLHIRHVRAYTIRDYVARMERMEGFCGIRIRFGACDTESYIQCDSGFMQWDGM